MKIDKVILSSNENPEYLEFWPLVSEAWKRIGVEPVLIYTGKKEININGDIIHFYIKNLDSIFVSQNIRLLASALFEDQNCIISDIDSLPLSKKYFIDSVKNIDEDKFIVYRPDGAAKNMIPICWNLAKGHTWSRVFKVTEEKHIVNLLRRWYFINNKLQNHGWYTDQIMLKKYLDNFIKKEPNSVIKMNDSYLGFERFNRVRVEEDLYRLRNTDTKFTEFHMPKPLNKYQDLVNEVYNKSID